MELAYPAALLLGVIALPLLLLFARRRPRALAIPSLHGVAAAPRSLRMRFLWLPLVLRLAAVALLVVAAARPRVGTAETIIPAEGIDIALVLDISGSMEAASLGRAGSRLDAAKSVLAEFIEAREDDRIGLVVFKDAALPYAPPTLDHEALAGLLEDIDAGLLPADGTAIGLGIATAVNMLQDSSAASRIIIMLTDGVDNVEEAIAPLDAANIADVFGIRVYTVGIVGGFSNTNPELLEEIAEMTGARFYEAETADDLADVYSEIDTLETSGVERDRFIDYDEYAPWFAGGAALLLLGELALRSTWLRRVTP